MSFFMQGPRVKETFQLIWNITRESIGNIVTSLFSLTCSWMPCISFTHPLLVKTNNVVSSNIKREGICNLIRNAKRLETLIMVNSSITIRETANKWGRKGRPYEVKINCHIVGTQINVWPRILKLNRLKQARQVCGHESHKSISLKKEVPNTDDEYFI